MADKEKPNNNAPNEESEFERFEKLTKQLVQVPKSAIKNGEPRKIATPSKPKKPR